jgi:hypothetical protein
MPRHLRAKLQHAGVQIACLAACRCLGGGEQAAYQVGGVRDAGMRRSIPVTNKAESKHYAPRPRQPCANADKLVECGDDFSVGAQTARSEMASRIQKAGKAATAHEEHAGELHVSMATAPCTAFNLAFYP